MGFGESKLVPCEIHQIRRIFAVVDRERRMEANLLGIVAQQSCADPVKGAGPGQRVGHDTGVVAHHLACNPLDAAGHLARRPARECHHQDAARIGAVDDQMGHPMRQRVGFAGTRAGNDQQGRPWRAIVFQHAVFNGKPLLNIEGVEIGRSHGHD